MTLPGPSRTIIVQPIEQPAPPGAGARSRSRSASEPSRDALTPRPSASATPSESRSRLPEHGDDRGERRDAADRRADPRDPGLVDRAPGRDSASLRGVTGRRLGRRRRADGRAAAARTAGPGARAVDHRAPGPELRLRPLRRPPARRDRPRSPISRGGSGELGADRRDRRGVGPGRGARGRASGPSTPGRPRSPSPASTAGQRHSALTARPGRVARYRAELVAVGRARTTSSPTAATVAWGCRKTVGRRAAPTRRRQLVVAERVPSRSSPTRSAVLAARAESGTSCSDGAPWAWSALRLVRRPRARRRPDRDRGNQRGFLFVGGAILRAQDCGSWAAQALVRPGDEPRYVAIVRNTSENRVALAAFARGEVQGGDRGHVFRLGPRGKTDWRPTLLPGETGVVIDELPGRRRRALPERLRFETELVARREPARGDQEPGRPRRAGARPPLGACSRSRSRRAGRRAKAGSRSSRATPRARSAPPGRLRLGRAAIERAQPRGRARRARAGAPAGCASSRPTRSSSPRTPPAPAKEGGSRPAPPSILCASG